MEGVLGMSAQERERAFVIRQVVEAKLPRRVAGERLGLGVRQIIRLVKLWRLHGDAGLVSKQRGRISPLRLAAQAKALIAGHLREKYGDFGATLAAEKLAELDGLSVSKETVRKLQIELGLWQPKVRGIKRVFQARDRRPRFGELVQIDGSPHDWFEGRAPKCTLLVFIDDATSRLTALHFAPAETTRGYLLALKDHVLSHGVPLAFYSDRHGIFRVNAKEAVSGDGYTEFGRVLRRLNIALLCASTPQAKGRVERANQTLQDRLIKEMRLHGISDIAQANAFVPTFIELWNKKFAVPPREQADAHRPWLGSKGSLDAALARHDIRTLSKDLTFRTGGTLYGVKPLGSGITMRQGRIHLRHFLDGSMQVQYKDKPVTWEILKTYPVPSATEDEKTIDSRMAALLAPTRKYLESPRAKAA